MRSSIFILELTLKLLSFIQGWGAGSIWTRLAPAPALAKKGPALTGSGSGSGSYYYIRKYILRNAITQDIYRYITSFFDNYIAQRVHIHCKIQFWHICFTTPSLSLSFFQSSSFSHPLTSPSISLSHTLLISLSLLLSPLSFLSI